jgi:succinoglycan biosynthesis transport protein ExoP
MLQSNIQHSNRARSIVDGAQDPPEGGLGELVGFALGFLRRQYLLILIVTILALAISIIYLRVTPPVYTSQAKILFGNPKAQFVQQQSILADAPADFAQLETQLQILKSKAVAISVIDKLKLADDPDFDGSRRPFRSLLTRLKTFFGTKSSINESETKEAATDALIATFDDRLTASRISMSNVIEISFSSGSAERAAQIANAVANAYINDQLNAKFEASRTATAWLQDRLQELGQQALTAERAVSAFKSQNNIVAAGGKLMDEQQVSDLNSRLVGARAQTSDALTRLNRFQVILRSNSENANAATASLDAAISDVLTSPIINNLRQQYLDYSRREAEWSSRFGRDHLAVVNLRARMRDIRSSILDEVRRLTEASKSDYEIAKQRQEEIEKQLAQAVSQSRTTGSAELTVRELEMTAKGYRNLYESFLQRYMGSVQQESFPITEARVISPASPPQGKSKPKTTLILALGFFGGIALGTGLGLLRDIMDRVFRTTAQVEAMLHMPCLSLVPLLKASPPPRQLPRAQSQNDAAFGPRLIVRGPEIFWAAIYMPLSRFTESLRAVRLAIDLNLTNASNKVIGITSSLPNEGKSTISAALAELIAHSGGRVILVDCDLRNPSLSCSLAPTAKAGLVEVISGEKSLEETVWRDPKTHLYFLPTVKKSPLFHTSEILAADQTKMLFDKLRSNFDYVIVDLPPLAPIIDVRATAPLIDAFILAIEWGRTKTDVVQHALHMAPNVHEALIGAVLNKTDMKAIRRYDTYHNDYYSNKHYARYGYTG